MVSLKYCKIFSKIVERVKEIIIPKHASPLEVWPRILESLSMAPRLSSSSCTVTKTTTNTVVATLIKRMTLLAVFSIPTVVQRIRR